MSVVNKVIRQSLTTSGSNWGTYYVTESDAVSSIHHARALCSMRLNAVTLGASVTAKIQLGTANEMAGLNLASGDVVGYGRFCCYVSGSPANFALNTGNVGKVAYFSTGEMGGYGPNGDPSSGSGGSDGDTLGAFLFPVIVVAGADSTWDIDVSLTWLLRA